MMDAIMQLVIRSWYVWRASRICPKELQSSCVQAVELMSSGFVFGNVNGGVYTIKVKKREPLLASLVSSPIHQIKFNSSMHRSFSSKFKLNLTYFIFEFRTLAFSLLEPVFFIKSSIETHFYNDDFKSHIKKCRRTQHYSFLLKVWGHNWERAHDLSWELGQRQVFYLLLLKCRIT